MNNYAQLCLIAGIALAFAIILGGAPGFFWMLLFGGIGTVAGLHLDGRIDLTAIVSGSGRGRG